MNSSDALLADLTAPQREAVTHVDGPLLIIAAAGSGKTRVITRRVAYLIGLGIPANAIFAVTFTNKAAAEMKARVSASLTRPLRDFGRLDQPWPIICTFHSLCLRILRHYGPTLGPAANFGIFDDGDQAKLIRQAVEDVGGQLITPALAHAAISRAKNRLQTPDDFAQSAHGFRDQALARIYAKYQALLAANNALDFDDLLMRAVLALRDQPRVLADLQERMQYLLIDEYQDTNHAQYILAHALAMRRRNICVVGDPDQSIYAWRGADIQNILDFEKDYPDAKVVRLEQNYRSTKTILEIAGKLITHNRRRKEKRLWTENPQGEKAELYYCHDEHDEAAVVAQRLRALRGQYDWNQMAVFYRVNALSRVMEDALRRAAMPYQIVRGVEFYNRKEIKDVLAYLRVIANPRDELSLARIANVPARGISAATLKDAQAAAVARGVGLFELLRQGVPAAAPRATAAVAAFVALVERRRTGLYGAPVPVQKIMDAVVRESGLQAMLEKLRQADRENEQLENVEELISAAAEFDEENPGASLSDYLARVSLVSDVDSLKEGGAITLMTLHAAKGLEFPVVAIIGLEDGLLPHMRVYEDPPQMEEERRLCFVGITRARERLLLSMAADRMLRGRRERTVPSPFLHELPREALAIVDHTGTEHHDQPTVHEVDPTPPPVSPGQLVRHAKFGLGRVVDVRGAGSQTRADVDFNTAGRKTLVLSLARLEPID